MTPFAELVTATNFSFLSGASHAQDLVLTALLLGQSGIGIADRNSVAGVVRAYGTLEDLRNGELLIEKQREGSGPGEYRFKERYSEEDLPFTAAEIAARAKNFRLAVGARLVFTDGTPDIVAYPQDREGWGRLCRVLTRGNLKGKKGECLLEFSDLRFSAAGLNLIVMPGKDTAGLETVLAELARTAAVWLGAPMTYKGDDRRRLLALEALAARTGTPLIATNDVLYHAPEQRDLQD